MTVPSRTVQREMPKPRPAPAEAARESAHGHSVAGRFVEDLNLFLEDRLPADVVAEVLRRANEPGRVEPARGYEPWVPYERFQRLLASAAQALGGAESLREFGMETTSGRSGAEVIELIQSLGTPEVMFATLPALTASVLPPLTVEVDEVAPREWTIRSTIAPTLELSPEFRAMLTGQYQACVSIFGYEQVEVLEEPAASDGSRAGVFRVRWRDVDPTVRERQFAELRAGLSSARLEQFQALVVDVVSEAGAAEVLRRIVRATARAVAAPQCALVLERQLPDVGPVVAEGFGREAALRLARELLSGPAPLDPDRQVVEVVSGQRRYGYLVVLDPGARLFARATGVVETYAQLAAGFLATRAALEESKRDVRTARSLLDLSQALAEIVTPDEMALKLARVAPSVLGCQRAAVYLLDSGGAEPRLAAADGFDEEAVLRSVDLEELARTGAPSGTRLAAIRAKGETIGWILVEFDEEAAGYAADAVEERLSGLAAHGAGAIVNARLVDQIRHQAFHDVLTGLANRALILDRVEHMLVRNRRIDAPVAALFIDLDGFKSVNDTLGHDAGDALLRAVAGRLIATVRAADTVGRLGGDEFVVLVDGASMDAAPELVAERILAVLSEPFELAESPGRPLLLTASVGIACGDRSSAAEMLRDADIALYEAKGAGKNRVVTFEAEMQTAMQDHMLLEMDLRGALEADQFFLLYQPIFELESGIITGVEALLRWRHPVRGVVGPDDFIPVLEATGMIAEVGDWVLRSACEEGVRLHAAGHHLTISVNVSIRQLERPTFIAEVRDALAASGLDPATLILEITETALMHDVEAVVPGLEALRAIGVRIAIDDFGTGYSSLAYLQRFPVDTLKIDRSFISAMAGSADSRALVHTLVQLGKTLNLETLAEGIEEQTQYNRLQGEECDSGQGYLFARPLDLGGLHRFLARQNTTAPSRTGPA